MKPEDVQAGWLAGFPCQSAYWFYSDACLSVQIIIARIKKKKTEEEEIESSYLAGLLKVYNEIMDVREL